VNSQLAAVVLCGGFSTRMGRDKGSMPAGDTIWAVQAAAKAILLNLDVYYSIREEQLPLYSPYIDADRFIIDNSPLEGPLKGLATAHGLLPGQDIFLLACDMPGLPCTTAYTLISEYISCSNDFFAFYEDGFYQPFCAVYTSAGLKQVLEQQPSSLQEVLRRGDTLQILPPDATAFQHRNAPDLL
jgi:molybdopterin-guanine dinucleotide biosynthesis protein A